MSDEKDTVQVAVMRTRLQFDPKMNYEKPLMVACKPQTSVKELKQLIHEKQKLLSTGEVARSSSSESCVIVPPKDQILVVKNDHDRRFHQMLLEDDLPLSTYGVDDRLETNVFLRRTNRTQFALAQFVLIDQRFLTPSQQNRFNKCLTSRDYHGALRCTQM
uniref:Ubiquitin-like domain-containing protein n=1 Tax=Aureoumbra lagunensis TaxID=44058 RepID=A0A7S3NRH7_9STRA|mmetsp:Transcript_8792/g.12233  ORF Transcript_8792/g.12233 Transcript_8792/m.12233 type:complete len:161 (-) Transcript_8792:270-752(-)